MKKYDHQIDKNTQIAFAILDVVAYFALFQYPPTRAEVYRFLSVATEQEKFNIILHALIKDKKLCQSGKRVATEYSFFALFEVRKVYSDTIISKTPLFLTIFTRIPFIRYVGYSGSLSMQNSDRVSDVDFFVITRKNTIWIVRMLLLVVKKILKLVATQYKSERWCFNLFFDDEHLRIEKKKQTVYVGHELLQLRPVLDSSYTYMRLLGANAWIHKHFPNTNALSQKYVRNSDSYLDALMLILNFALKQLQIWWMKRTGYVWREESGQLWLLQQDFEKTLSKHSKS